MVQLPFLGTWCFVSLVLMPPYHHMAAIAQDIMFVHLCSKSKERRGNISSLLLKESMFLSEDFHLYLNGKHWITGSLLAAGRPGKRVSGLR